MGAVTEVPEGSAVVAAAEPGSAMDVLSAVADEETSVLLSPEEGAVLPKSAVLTGTEAVSLAGYVVVGGSVVMSSSLKYSLKPPQPLSPIRSAPTQSRARSLFFIK